MEINDAKNDVEATHYCRYNNASYAASQCEMVTGRPRSRRFDDNLRETSSSPSLKLKHRQWCLRDDGAPLKVLRKLSNYR